MTWIKKFLAEEKNKYFIEIDADWIKDKFNHTDLLSDLTQDLSDKYLPCHYKGMRMIVDIPGEYSKIHTESASFFYGLLHARYVLTNAGINRLLAKYDQGLYGSCPKLECDSNLLPIGEDGFPGFSKLKLYCPACDDIFKSDSELDSAYFGNNLPHMFFMVKPEKRPVKKKENIYKFDEDHNLDHNLYGGKCKN